MSSTGNNGAANNKDLLSKTFGDKLTSVSVEEDSASTMSGATLVPEQQSTSSTSGPALSQGEQSSLSDLMAKANTMPPDEFKAYLARYKQNADAAEREKQPRKKSWMYSKEFLNNEQL